jgi:hypothetical protein
VKALLPLLLLVLAGCPSQRVLRLENEVLRLRNTELTETLATSERRSLLGEDYASKVDLETIHRFLTRSGFVHTYTPEARHISVDYSGTNQDFSVTLQVFESADVLYLATSGYLSLADATDTGAVVMVLTQLASLNYEMLVGKFQMNPETGEVILSAELHLESGLSASLLTEVVDLLCRTADDRYPNLATAAAGVGI